MKKIISIGEAERLAKEYIDEQNEEALNDFVEEVLGQEKVIGSSDDFHNFSINFSRKDDYETACNILDKGLEQFPNSVDLLADYLNSGINCGRFELCQKYYQRLMGIPKMRWTWRGFSFGISYMKFLADAIMDEESLIRWRNDMLHMADTYRKHFPHDEDCFLSKAYIYQYFNDKESEIKVLESAMELIKVCPRCALRLADVYFEKGEYEKTVQVIRKCQYGAIQTQERVNQGYLYYLSGLCKAVLLHQAANYNNYEEVKDIYCDFKVAEKLKISRASYRKVMERQIDILETKTGIVYDDVYVE